MENQHRKIAGYRELSQQEIDLMNRIKAKGADSAAIADYLHNGLKGYSGLSGEIAFNEKGDRVGNLYYLYQVNDKGEFVMQQD